MKTVLVTTDLSTNSKSGIRFAMQLALQGNYNLVFYYVVEVMKPTSWNDQRFRNFEKDKLSEAEDRLAAFVQKVFQASGKVAGNFKYKVETGTRIAESTIAAAKAVKADLICLGTRGGGAVKKLIGTVATDLLTTSPVPVIVVPERYRVRPVKTLFYSTDMESLSTELKKVQLFAQTLKARTEVYYYDYLLMEPLNVKKMEKRVEKFKAPGINFNFRRLSVEETLAKHINKDVIKDKPSVLVLFTKQNRSWFEKLFLSSKAAELALKPNVPLLVFRKNKKT